MEDTREILYRVADNIKNINEVKESYSIFFYSDYSSKYNSAIVNDLLQVYYFFFLFIFFLFDNTMMK